MRAWNIIIFCVILPGLIIYLMFVASPAQLPAEENSSKLVERVWLSIILISTYASASSVFSKEYDEAMRDRYLWPQWSFLLPGSRFSTAWQICSVGIWILFFSLLAFMPYGVIVELFPKWVQYRIIVFAISLVFWGFVGFRSIKTYLRGYKESL